jgi:hypothetical protein
MTRDGARYDASVCRGARANPQLGLALALAHLALTLMVILAYLGSSPADASELYWIPLFILDLPFSAFAAALVMLGLPAITFNALPYPINDLQRFLAPALFHSIIGSLWYYLLPRVVTHLRWTS